MFKKNYTIIKDFYKTIMNFTGGCMPHDVTDALLECFIYEDDDAVWSFMQSVLQWYNTLPGSDLKDSLDYYFGCFDLDD